MNEQVNNAIGGYEAETDTTTLNGGTCSLTEPRLGEHFHDFAGVGEQNSCERSMGDAAKAGGSASNGAGTLQPSPTLDLQATIARLEALDKARTQGEWRYKYREREDGMYAGEVFEGGMQAALSTLPRVTEAEMTRELRKVWGVGDAVAPRVIEMLRAKLPHIFKED